VFVGVARLVLSIPGSRSLKEKRMVVRSFKERIQARMRVSIAEVGELDLHQRAVLGVAVVANEASQCDEVLASVAAAANTLRDAVLVDRSTEIVPFGDGGKGVRGRLGEDALPSLSGDDPWKDEDG
jgi:uncharacterized protein